MRESSISQYINTAVEKLSKVSTWKRLSSVLVLALTAERASAQNLIPTFPIDAASANPYVFQMSDEWLKQQHFELPQDYEIVGESLIVPGQPFDTEVSDSDNGLRNENQDILVFDAPEFSAEKKTVVRFTLEELPPSGSSFTVQVGEVSKFLISGEREGSNIFIKFIDDDLYVFTVDVTGNDPIKALSGVINISHLDPKSAHEFVLTLEQFEGKSRLNMSSDGHGLGWVNILPGRMNDVLEVGVYAASNDRWDAELSALSITSTDRAGAVVPVDPALPPVQPDAPFTPPVPPPLATGLPAFPEQLGSAQEEPDEAIVIPQVNPYVFPMNEELLRQQGAELPENFIIHNESLLIYSQSPDEEVNYLVFESPRPTVEQKVITTIVLNELPTAGASLTFQIGGVGEYLGSGGEDGGVIFVTVQNNTVFLETIRVDMVNDEERRTSKWSMTLDHLPGKGPYEFQFTLQDFPDESRQLLSITARADGTQNFRHIGYIDIPNPALQGPMQMSLSATSPQDWSIQVNSFEIRTEPTGLEASNLPAFPASLNEVPAQAPSVGTPQWDPSAAG